MENLLATPATALEVMTGKIVPYVLIGLIQVTLVLLLARLHVQRADARQPGAALPDGAAVHRRQPDAGAHVLSAGAQPAAGDADDVFLFPAVDAAIGLHVPVPRHAGWAQAIGEALPLTHFVRIVRGVLLKGNGWSAVMPDAWPIALFMVIVILIGLRFFRSTLD